MKQIVENNKLYPSIQDWHGALAHCALDYKGAKYRQHGRTYNEIDIIGLVLGAAAAVGRPLGDCESLTTLVTRLTPVKIPKTGDIVIDTRHHASIIINGNKVLTCDDSGVKEEKWRIFSRFTRRVNEEYEYYCLLRGVWHVGH